MTSTAKSPMLLKVAAIAAAFSLQGAALAAAVNEPAPLLVAAAEQNAATPAGQAETPRAERSMRGHHHRHSKEQRAVMMVPGYGGLSEAAVKTLGLNEAQSKLLTEAQNAQKEARKSRYEAMKTERQAQSEQLKAGKIDPHAAVKQADEARGKALEARNQITAKWFALWDSLDATQHQKVATLLAERSAQRSEHMKHMKRMHKGAEQPQQMRSESAGAAS